MGQSGDFYIAWDGRRYDGTPPTGWFLAADNRWWPTPDLIGGPQDARNDDDRGNQVAQPEPPEPATHAAPDEAQAPIQSSYPDATTSPRSTNRSTTSPGSTPRRRRKTKNFRWIGQALFFLFFFRACLGGPAFNFSSDTEEASTPEPIFEVASLDDYEATINSCLGNAPTGLIRNRTDTRVRFSVVVEVTTATGELETWTSQPTLTIAPGVLTSWRADIPAGDAPATDCSIAFVESKVILE